MTTTKTTADGLDHQTKTVPIVDRSILMHVTLRLAKSFFFWLPATPRAAVPSPLPGRGRGRGPWGVGRRFVGFWAGWSPRSPKYLRRGRW